MKVSIQRAATYAFPMEVRASIHYLRLTPQSNARQQVLNWELDLPQPTREVTDAHGNLMRVLTIEGLHTTLELGIRGQVVIDENCESEPDEGRSPLPYLRPTSLTECDEALLAMVWEVCGEQRDRAALVRLMEHLHGEMVKKQAQLQEQSGEPVDSGTLVLCDSRSLANQHAHAFIAAARAMGVPARYAAGYLLDPEAGSLRVHGWAEAWFDGAWYSFDVTSNLSRASRHLRLAIGMDALDACPVRGTSRSSGMMVGFDTCRINKLQKLA